MALDYWYDGQLRRYYLQFARIFAGFQYQTGIGASGTTTLITVPITYASKDAMVGQILKNNSENVISSSPQMSFWMSDLTRDPERIQSPNFVSTVQVVEREIDPATNKYTANEGKHYTVQRFMPVPYEITMQLDLWTTNEDQKQQIMEQILVLFNPSIDLQTSVNPLDWTSLGIVTLDSISWSNREVPIGTDTASMEVSSMSFKMPIWITPPAKVKKQTLINQIVMNIGTMGQEDPNCNTDGVTFNPGDFSSRVIVTPQNYRLEVDGSILTLLSDNGLPITDTNPQLTWKELLELYGHFRPGVSQIRLKTNDNMDDHTTDIIGTVDFIPNQPYQLQWTIDPETLHQDTIPAVDRIIDPAQSHPGHQLPASAEGQRYLLVEDTIQSDWTWGNISAHMNDIIEFQNGQWVITFDASATTTPAFVTNNTSGKQYYWTGDIWREAVSGEYMPGYWRVVL